MATAYCFAQHGHGHGHGQGSARPSTTFITVASDQQSFWLFIDEVQQNERSVRSIKVESVPIGEHYIRVEFDNNEHNTVGQYVQLQNAHNSYWIMSQRNMFGITLGREIPRTDAVVALSQAQQQYQPNPSNGHRPPYGAGMYYPQHPQGPQGPQHPQGPQTPPPPQPNHPNPGSHHDGHPAGQTNICMNEHDFNAALATIRNESFENTKLSTAQQVIANNLLCINQIAQICQLFDFENTKLDFAKRAYHRCTEKEQYYLLHSVFQFDNSKKELDRYVQQQQR